MKLDKEHMTRCSIASFRPLLGVGRENQIARYEGKDSIFNKCYVLRSTHVL